MTTATEPYVNPWANTAAAAGEADDLSKAAPSGSNFKKREPARAGVALLRLLDYIEVGVFESKTAGYKPQKICKLTFELNHPDHMITLDNGDKIPGILTVQVPYAGKKGSYYRNLFDKMNYTGSKTHFSQMLGDAFLGELFHTVVDEGTDKEVTYVNLNDPSRAWTIGAPRQNNVIEGTVTEIPVPELHGTPRLFLWENAGTTDAMIQEMWDSIFMEGEFNGESKNWIQDSISSEKNLEWTGSRTQSIVENGVVKLPAELAAAASAPTQVAGATVAAVVENAVVQPTETKPVVDVLATLGI